MTRFTYKYLKPVAILLLLTFLIQSCTVYDKHPTAVENAVDLNKKVKILFDDGRKLVYDKIYYKDDCLLYGAVTTYDSNNKRKKISVIIPEEKIVDIYNYDVKKSRKKTTLLIVCTGLGGLLIWGIVVLFEPEALDDPCMGFFCN